MVHGLARRRGGQVPLVAALVVLQLPLGSEHGPFGVQPVEAAKLALLLVLAFLGMQVEELGFVGAQQ